MSDTLFEQLVRLWPDSLLESIYQIYPRHESRKQAIGRIREALNRICDGEIDGQPRTQEQAAEYLRQKTAEARSAMFGRDQKFIPHPTSYYHGRKYLRPELSTEALPPQLDAAIRVLGWYPGIQSAKVKQDLRPFLPGLCAISKCLETHDEEYLTERTKKYAAAVATWPAEELRFVPNSSRWFSEGRFAQNEKTWYRKTGNFEEERSQIVRVLNS